MDGHSSRHRAPLLAALAAVALLLSPATARPVAAAEELRIAANSTYVVDPAGGAVHVTIDITATNLKPNRVTSSQIIRYYWDELGFGIHEQAASVRATASGQRLSVTTKRDDGFTALTVRLANRLDYRETHRLRIQFDLPGGEPRSTSPIRVGEAFAAFYAWAWGDPGRANITIVLPSGFDDTVNGSALARRVEGNETRLTATAIAEPQEWFVTIDAQRTSSLRRDVLTDIGAAEVTVRSWPEDQEWRTKVVDLLSDGLPELQKQIGLAWPLDGRVNVYEVYTPLLEGYAGVFYPGENRIDIGEDLDDLTIVHEAAHAWFNNDLFRGRWITEGLADEYAALVLEALDRPAEAPDAVAPDDAAAIRLNGWTHPGRIEDEETDDREQYGYHASWTVIRAIVDEIGVDGMRRVFAAAEANEIAYVGAPDPESVAAADDWRRFLDLLEERGRSTGAEAVLREWVTESADDTLLDDRAEARKAYAALVADGDGWLPPFVVRDEMGAWNFDEATDAIGEATAVLDDREVLEARSEALGLTLSDRLETAYEAAEDDFEAAESIAQEQRASLDALEAARATLDAERDAITTLGLWGVEPEARFAAAAAAFDADEGPTTIAEADAAVAMIAAAPEVGRTRAAAAGGAAGGVVALAGMVILVRRRRRARAVAAHATPAAAAPYGTLAADPAAPPIAPQPQAEPVLESVAPDPRGDDGA